MQNAMSGKDGETRAVLRNVHICYFLSGALGLAYQVLWLRKLLLVFGSTVHAVSTVLTVFFAGLALGSWWFGRLIDARKQSGLRWYAWLEIGIGLYAFLTPVLFDLIRGIYVPIYRASGLSPTVLVWASFGCSLAILLLPTILMGGSFPVMSRFLVQGEKDSGTAVARLYAVNTAGAMAGTLAVYFVGLPMLGLSRTLQCAGVLNLGIGLLCLVFDRHLSSLKFESGGAHRAGPGDAAAGAWGRNGWLVAAFGLSGFASIAYEVSWTRALSLVLGSSIYAFCMILATFLGGMALGSFYAREQLERKPASIEQFVSIELLLAVCGLMSLVVFHVLPDAFVTFWHLFGNAFSGLISIQFILCALVMIVPTVLLGYLFPVVSDLLTRGAPDFGRRLGAAYAVNTIGGIFGSFLTGFVLIPMLGLAWAIVAAALVNAFAGLMIYLRFNPGPLVRRGVFSAAALGAYVLAGSLVATQIWPKKAMAAGAYLNPENFRGLSVAAGAEEAELVFYRDSLNATVTVHRRGDNLYLKVGGKTDASNGIDMSTQALSAHIPMLLHPDPRSVLVIGLGSGVTLGNVSRYPVSKMDCAELEPAVVEASREFRDYNYRVHDDPRTRMFVADGRNFLLASPDAYDVIISEPSNPWMAGVASLFTKEFYELARARLAGGGIMCQWLQLYRIFPEDVKLIVKTYHDVFPYVTVWTTVPGDLLLIGSMEPLALDYAAVAQRMGRPEIAESLLRVRIDKPEILFQTLLFGNRELEQLTADVTWDHHDDQPWIEFNAPKALYADHTLSMNVQGFEQFRVSLPNAVSGYDPKLENAAFWRSMGELWGYRGEPRKQQDALREAIKLDPDDWRAWVAVGQVSLMMRETSLGLEALERATALAPGEPGPAARLANAYFQQRDFEKAQRWFLRSAASGAPESLLAEQMGDCFRMNGQLNLAAEFYRSSVALGGGARSALLIAYAGVLRSLKDWPNAERLLQVARLAFPSEPAFVQLLGATLLDQDRNAEAAEVLLQAIKMKERNVEGRYDLARIALASGSRPEAMRLLRDGLRYGPYHQKSLELLDEIKRQQQ